MLRCTNIQSSEILIEADVQVSEIIIFMFFALSVYNNTHLIKQSQIKGWVIWRFDIWKISLYV